MLNLKNSSYSVFFEEAPEGGYVVSVPALPGCHTQGDTLEEAENNIKEAIEVYLESYVTNKEPIPQEKRSFISNINIGALTPSNS